jgi:hypothetical protein
LLAASPQTRDIAVSLQAKYNAVPKGWEFAVDRSHSTSPWAMRQALYEFYLAVDPPRIANINKVRLVFFLSVSFS